MNEILNSNDIDEIYNYYYDSNNNLHPYLKNNFFTNQIQLVNKILKIIKEKNQNNKYNIAFLFASELIEKYQFISITI
jgi:mevalonate pyrophosphate decarboxylase